MPIAYSIRCDDVQKAQRFLLSMLWRASITSHDFFRHVELGEKREDDIRLLLLSGTEVREADWEFVVIRFFDNPYDRGIMPPWKGRYPDIEAYNFYLPYYNFLIRADRRQFHDDFSEARFLSRTNCLCLRLPFKETPEARYIGSIALSLRKRKV
jgi:hypothetical protein